MDWGVEWADAYLIVLNRLLSLYLIFYIENKKLYDEINIRITIKNFPHFRRDRQSAHLISGKPNETLYIESPLDQFGLLFTFAK